MPRKRRILIPTLLALVAVGLLALGFFPQEPLRRWTESRLRAAVGGEVRLGGLRILPAALRADLTDLLVETPVVQLHVPRARIDFAAPTLWTGSLDLDSLEIESPRLTLRPAPPAPAAPAPALLPPLRVANVTLTRGRLTYRDPALGGDLTVEELSARGGIGDGALEVTSTRGRWARAEPLHLGPSRLRVRVSSRLDLHIDTLHVETEGSHLEASGPLGPVGKLRPELRYQGLLNLAALARLFGRGPASGDLRAQGRLSSAGPGLRLDGTFEGRDLVLAGYPVDRAEIRAGYAVSGDGSIALELALLGGGVSGQADLRGTRSRGSLRAWSIDPGRLPSGPPLSGSLAGKLEWDGDLARSLDILASIEASGRTEAADGSALASVSGRFEPRGMLLDLGWTAALNGRGRAGAAAVVADARLGARGTARGAYPPAVSGTIEGGLDLRGPRGPVPARVDGSFEWRGGALKAGLAAQGLGGRASLEAEAHGRDVRRLELRTAAVQVGQLSADARGELRLNLDASGPLEALAVRGEGGVRSLAWKGLALGDVSAAFQRTALRTEASLAIPDLHVRLTGTLGTERQPTLRAQATFEETPLQPLSPLLPGAASLAGAVTGTADIELPTARPRETAVRARIERLQLESGPFRGRAGPFTAEMRDRRVAVDGLRLEGPGFRLQASGTMGLDPDSSLDLRTSGAFELPPLPMPQGWAISGIAEADLALSGTLGRPSVAGTVRGREMRLSGPALPQTTIDTAELLLDGDAVVIPGLEARLAEGTARLAGRVPLASLISGRRAGALRPRDEANLRLTWRDVRLAGMESPLAGELEIGGGLASLSEVRARLAVPATDLTLQEQRLRLEPFGVRLENGRLSTDGLILGSDRGSLRLGGAIDLATRRLDLAGAGALDLRLLSPFVTQAALSGNAQLDVKLGGTIEQPSVRGSVDVRDGTLRLRDIPQALTAIEARLAFDEAGVRVEKASGALGGGALTLSGEAALRGLGIGDLRLDLRGRDVALRYPAGLKARLDADLALNGRPGAFRLSGDVRVVRGLYDLEVAIAETMRAPVAAPTESPLLRAVALDVAVTLENPVLVRNSLAELEVTGRLTARGDMENPAPFGRLAFRPDGKVFLQGRDFRISSGGLEYRGTWDPELSLVATRKGVRPEGEGESRDHDITVAVQGPLESPRLRFSSEPSLTEREILSIIATGRRESAALDSGAWIVGGQAATLLTGRLTREVARTLGLDEVTVRPDLVARETDPSARFTFGKEVVRQVSLIYSVGLSGPESRFFQLLGRPLRNARALIQRSDNGVFTYGVGQRFAFGGAPAPPGAPKEEAVHLSDVRLTGHLPLPESELRNALQARPGRKASPFDLQEDTDRLRERLRREGYLEAEVGVTREGDAAVFRLLPGPRYTWRIEGMDRPPRLEREILGALYEEEALERGGERLLEVLRDRGHLRASVTTRVESADGGRVLVFAAEPGPRLRLGEVRFPGAEALSSGALLRAAGGPAALLTRPQAAAEAIRAAYVEHHYLAARVELPRLREDGGRVSIEVPIEEGPPARVVRVGFEGITLPEGKLAVVAGLEKGAPYEVPAVEAATRRLRDHYLALGSPAVRVRPEARAEGSDVAVVFRVTEGERVVIGQTVMSGLSRTRESLVRRQLDLRLGQPLDPRRLAAAERRLNQLGTFSRVAVTASEDPGTVQVLVEEGPAFSVGYDFRYDDTKGAGGLVDGELHNLFGRGLLVGGRYALAADSRETRVWLRLPAFGPGGDLTGSVFRTEEDLDADGIPVTQRQTGFQIQESLRFPGRWDVFFGYRYRRSLTLSSLFPAIPLNTSGVEISVLREGRDNLLDARSGSFLSATLELSPTFLRTDAPFIKGFAQASVAVPLAPSLTWAQSYRLGLASGLGGRPLISFERFRAGGASSLRGFATDSVGPSADGDPLGGEAVLVLNQEVRYHHASGFGAVVFYDGGNVYPTVKEMSFHLRHTLGAGLRWASPVGLLRLDVGFPLGRQEGLAEKPYRFFFSLGQAF